MFAWLTPDSIEEVGTHRSLCVPTSFFPYVTGALQELTKEKNWEKFGDTTVEEAAAAGWSIYESYLEGCDAMEISYHTVRAGETYSTGSWRSLLVDEVLDPAGWATNISGILNVSGVDGYYRVVSSFIANLSTDTTRPHSVSIRVRSSGGGNPAQVDTYKIQPTDEPIVFIQIESIHEMYAGRNLTVEISRVPEPPSPSVGATYTIRGFGFVTVEKIG